MSLIHGPPIRVQPFFGFRNRDRLFLSARALRAGKPGFEPAGRIRALRTMLAQFASREEPDLPVRLEIERPDGARFEHHGRTDKEGFVHFEVSLEGKWDFAAHTQWEAVTIHWDNRKGTQSAQGHVLAPGGEADLAVISDIDDTIIETGITGSFRAIARNWRRVLAQFPDERIAVPGSDVFYNALGGGPVLQAPEAQTGDTIAANHRPFFYVSSSPWNLYSYLVAFKRSRGLPLGPLMLRDWGLNRETFGSSSHGHHKQAAIRRILSHYPEIRFALIGDDTQGDLTAYGGVVAENPARIAAVFIRKAASEDFSPEEVQAKQMIEEAGVPLWLGDDYSTGQDFLRDIGLQRDDEAQQIIETVEKVAG